MIIQTYKLDPKILAQSPNRKFVLYSNLSKEQILVISAYENPPGHQHKELIPQGNELIGAGHIYYENNGYKVQWGSQSCREKFGYDRPSGELSLLDEIKKNILNWDLEQIMKNQ